VAAGSRREAKNRISRKIKNVAEVSKVPLKILSSVGIFDGIERDFDRVNR
jgi:hypothetical protein